MYYKILFILLILTSCKFDTNAHIKFITSISNLIYNNTNTGQTSSTNTNIAPPAFTNLINKSIVETGFILGTAASGIASVEISIDSGSYTSATGTTNWTFKLPIGSATWKEGSLHTIAARAVDASGNKSSITSISVRKGKNKDINGDGYADLAIGATGYSSGIFKGAVYVFYSSGASGISSGLAGTANTSIVGQSNNDKFGYAIAMGDINGDGYSDLVASSPYSTAAKGTVYIFHSTGANGITATNISSANSSVVGESSNDNFGNSVSVGDINGDGYADLIASAFGYPTSAGNGRIYVFHSSGSNGITAANISSANSTITGNSVFDNLGIFISTGDVNGDGFADLAAGAYGYPGGSLNGAVFIFHSSGAGGITATTPTVADSKIIGGTSGDYIGVSVCFGDINGDGYSDLAVGAKGTSSNKGNVYLFYSSGTSGITASNVSAANTSILGMTANDQFGFSISLGDVNGDGYADLAASASSYSGGNNKGIVYLFNSTGSSGISVNSVNNATNSISGSSNSDSLGYFTSMGDYNGDGYPDLAIAAKGYNAGSLIGRVYIFHSNTQQGITAGTVSSANSVITGSSTNDSLGTALPVF